MAVAKVVNSILALVVAALHSARVSLVQLALLIVGQDHMIFLPRMVEQVMAGLQVEAGLPRVHATSALGFHNLPLGESARLLVEHYLRLLSMSPYDTTV